MTQPGLGCPGSSLVRHGWRLPMLLFLGACASLQGRAIERDLTAEQFLHRFREIALETDGGGFVSQDRALEALIVAAMTDWRREQPYSDGKLWLGKWAVTREFALYRPCQDGWPYWHVYKLLGMWPEEPVWPDQEWSGPSKFAIRLPQHAFEVGVIALERVLHQVSECNLDDDPVFVASLPGHFIALYPRRRAWWIADDQRALGHLPPTEFADGLR